MKPSFSLIELLLTLFLISIVGSIFLLQGEDSKLQDASKRLELYLKHLRYQALIDEKYEDDNNLWHKKRWTLKFFNCRKSVGGIYYSIYSDTNMTGHPSLEESLSDPLTGKKIYSTNRCEEKENISKYVLLTKEFGIESIDITCNETSTIGQLSFGSDGKVYSRLSSYDKAHYDYEIKKPCIIRLKDQKNCISEIIVEPMTAYSRIKK